MTLQIMVHEAGRVRLLQLAEPKEIDAVMAVLKRLRGDAAIDKGDARSNA